MITKADLRGLDEPRDTEMQVSGTVEPPFSYEVHLKKNIVMVRVQLHKVPPQVIDVDSTTPTRLIVQTPKYTKKFLLNFLIPDRITINPSAAEYTFENGTLLCELPIEGPVPESAIASRQEILHRIQQEKNLRFRTNKQGELIVRSRTALLKPTEGTSAAQARRDQPSKDMKKRSVETEVPKSMHEIAEKKSAEKSRNTNVKRSFVADSDLPAAARVASQSARQKLAEKLRAMKQLHAQKVMRAKTREDRRSTKKERERMAFERVLVEQKRQMLRRQKSIASPAPRGSSAKAVRFAD
jgi:hypothetical protein